MSIPDFQSLMLPAVKFAADGKEHSLAELREAMARQFRLTDAERAELLPSGRQPTFENRVGWSVTYLRKARLFEATGRGRFRITARGQQAIKECKDRLDLKYLGRFEEVKRFRAGTEVDDAEATTGDGEPLAELTPEELLTRSYQALRQSVADELLDRLAECSPRFFEQKVVELLVKMGYGGAFANAGEHVGGPGDEGIDGLIKEDKLGLDVIYVQAKRWARDKRVGRPELQKFAGSLLGRRARKGVFITTAGFAKETGDYVRGLDQKIVLIDGARLAELMIEHGLGVTVKQNYPIHKVDEDFFEDG